MASYKPNYNVTERLYIFSLAKHEKNHFQVMTLLPKSAAYRAQYRSPAGDSRKNAVKQLGALLQFLFVKIGEHRSALLIEDRLDLLHHRSPSRREGYQLGTTITRIFDARNESVSDQPINDAHQRWPLYELALADVSQSGWLRTEGDGEQCLPACAGLPRRRAQTVVDMGNP